MSPECRGGVGGRAGVSRPATSFAGLALLVAVVGLAGVVARSVVERRRELAVRLALGASPDRVVGGVLREGLVTTAVGVGAGLGAAALAARGLARSVYGVSPYDPVSFGLAALVVTTLALAACYPPAAPQT